MITFKYSLSSTIHGDHMGLLRKKIISILLVLILYVCIFNGFNMQTDIAGASDHTLSECQLLIDDINQTLTSYNSTLCYYNGTEGISTPAVNNTTEMMMLPLCINYGYNSTVADFSQNQTLLNEWQSIRTINSNCSPHDFFNCEFCNIARCLSNLTYEEIITAELLNRGLFDFALNSCLRYKITHICEP